MRGSEKSVRCSEDRAVELLESYNCIALTSHMRPDGDAIGSLLGLGLVLKGLGKKVHLIHEDGVTANLAFLDTDNFIIKANGEVLEEVELFVALDTANKVRIGENVLASIPNAARCLVIDHHITNELYGDENWVDDKASATAEMLAHLILRRGWEVPDAARDALYVGISTDTGSFQFSNTTKRTHEAAAWLLELGADLQELTSLTYYQNPLRRLYLLEKLLGSLNTELEGKIVYWTLTKRMKNEAAYQAGDSEGLIDLMRSTAGVKVCIFFEEIYDGSIRMSVRSNDFNVDVSRFCGLFGGGGHKMAAGARMEGPVEGARARAIKEVIKMLEVK